MDQDDPEKRAAKEGGWRDRMLIGAFRAAVVIWLAAGIYFLLSGVGVIRGVAAGLPAGRSMMLGLLMIGVLIFIAIKSYFS